MDVLIFPKNQILSPNQFEITGDRIVGRFPKSIDMSITLRAQLRDWTDTLEHVIYAFGTRHWGW